MKEKVILAYSGGLDTTAIIPWLKENFDYEVVCVCIDCGQGEELDGLEERGPPHAIPLGHPSAPAPSFLNPASNLDWRFVSYVILHMFQCHSPKSSPPPSPTESKRLFYTHVSLLLSRIQYPNVHRSTVYNSQDMETT